MPSADAPANSAPPPVAIVALSLAAFGSGISLRVGATFFLGAVLQTLALLLAYRDFRRGARHREVPSLH